MPKVIIYNKTMAGLLPSLRKFNKKQKRMMLRLRGPKNIGLPDKPPNLINPQIYDLFNSTKNATIYVYFNEFENEESLFNVIIENKNKISFIFICGMILYIYFKKFLFIRIFLIKLKEFLIIGFFKIN
jgi:hypothetical protein